MRVAGVKAQPVRASSNPLTSLFKRENPETKRAALKDRLKQRIKESGFEGKPIDTMFDYIEFDEGRDPVASRAWEQ